MKLLRALSLVLFVALITTSCKKSETNNTATTDTTATYSTSTATPAATPTATSATSATVLNDTDKDFVTSVAKGGMAEVDLANDALKHATNPEVKTFAQKMADDHSKANQELTQLASTKGVTIPSEVQGGLKETKERLMKLTGKNFDQAFIKQMVEDHESTVKKFEDESTKAADADLKSWVNKTLPTLRSHLTAARDLQTRIGAK
jgi:putative membrane protein